MPSIELILSAFLLLTFIAAIISMRLKVPYTLILVLTGVLITVVVALLALQGSPIQAPMRTVIAQFQSIYNLLIQGGGGGLYVGLIVPPLIFEAMIHIRGSDLKTVIKPSLALGNSWRSHSHSSYRLDFMAGYWSLRVRFISIRCVNRPN